MITAPSAQSQMADAQGRPTPPWMRFFASLARGTAGAILNVTVQPSPMAYTAPAAGTLYISGGTITAVSLTRGPSSVAISPVPRIVSASEGDVVTVTYGSAPTMKFVPS